MKFIYLFFYLLTINLIIYAHKLFAIPSCHMFDIKDNGKDNGS